MLFDPFKEQFDFPSVLVELCYFCGLQLDYPACRSLNNFLGFEACIARQ